MSNSKSPKSEASITSLLEKIPNRFMLAMAAAKRARFLKEGGKPLVSTDEDPVPVLTALREIDAEKIHIAVRDEHQPAEELFEDIDDVLLEDAIASEVASAGAEDDDKKSKDKDSKKSKSKSLAA
ncbi:MAG: DNA-directed RNA polymerase subunit omega [Candidatus Margulisiibacteriota bacterium]